ncbi:xanthine dehydrogenase family protein molybdopterin-binding subunit [Flavobacterium sp. SORGH_AS_0622]|uniref:xanthine dehydrogenase family protein molybdopterin-binding subunit n=1 Tax=Flavobacterium sp. SORGH_AS_0622 TaxID=3041772 RepID=UPI00277D5E05|nr:xanthine dehydrogenase family protein molybdopterin-binding subunit [Flavobacterium sp. SORGH_AS_0622]MDQ1165638.1 xanthine dehydrogenase YagR molybdenum-binding subunit [Flavobacterium sp. SORGH_AS_0622]
MENIPLVGQPVSRLEGFEKVTGSALYAAEHNVSGLLYGYVVNSTITKGKILSIDVSAVLALEGVVKIFTHENRPSLAWFDLQYADMDAPPGTVFKPLSDNIIRYNGQPIALIVAEDFETARCASTLIKFVYEEEPFDTVLSQNLDKAREPKKGMSTPLKPPPPKPTGNFDKAYADAEFKVQGEYRHGTEHHNPLELFATTAIYEGEGKLTIYDKTQGTINNQLYVANVFGLKYKNVRVLAPYVGGAFGSGLRPQYQLFLCVLASLELKRNVRVTLERKQMFSFGHRPQTVQSLHFGADGTGKLTAMNHSAVGETSSYEDYNEILVPWGHKLYPASNTLFEYKLVPLDLATPIDMRAPGGVTGMHAIECIMDELAYKLEMDPLDFRLKNYSEVDPSTQQPFTSKELKQCYEKGAEEFGWHLRNPKPAGTKKGNRLVGWGMATGIWDAYQFPARAAAELTKEGRLEVYNATTDIGTGTLTVMTQIAADEFGISADEVSFFYGDSKMPFSMFQGGSAITASTGTAVIAAIRELKKKIIKKIKALPDSAFTKIPEHQIVFRNGGLSVTNQPDIFIGFQELIHANEGRGFKAVKLAGPDLLKLRKFSKAAHSASFVEVEVDKDLGTITVTRVVTAVAAGKIINPKTARSQVLGSIIWGISKALHEETLLDAELGKYMNTNLGEYHIPVHADIPEMKVIFADEKDTLINGLGVKGLGEIAMTAIPAAIANAVFHATGKRVNNLPIHFDNLLEPVVK